MIDTTHEAKLFCAHTDLALKDLSADQVEKLHVCTFIEVAQSLGFNIGRMTDQEVGRVELQMFGSQWVNEAIKYELLYAQPELLDQIFPNVEDWSKVEFEINPEIDHYDEEGNFVKGNPNE
jgi:hypothetical protein